MTILIWEFTRAASSLSCKILSNYNSHWEDSTRLNSNILDKQWWMRQLFRHTIPCFWRRIEPDKYCDHPQGIVLRQKHHRQRRRRQIPDRPYQRRHKAYVLWPIETILSIAPGEDRLQWDCGHKRAAEWCYFQGFSVGFQIFISRRFFAAYTTDLVPWYLRRLQRNWDHRF